MHLINSPWQKKFESFVALAKKELRVAAPYYSEEVIGMLLKRSKAATKHFLLSLSDHDVRCRVQSPAAVRTLMKNRKCKVKFAPNLHAKVLIADQQCAIVTSANLTGAGLSKNAELGVFLDDPEIVKSLVRTFDSWFAQADVVDAAVLAKLEKLRKLPKENASGKCYGKNISVAGLASKQPPVFQKKLGWILVHSRDYREGKYDSPKKHLDGEYEPGLKWHWKRGSPLSEGDGYTILFAWKDEIFGEATADVRHSDVYPDYNFAFVLRDYIKAKRPVRLSDLGLHNYQNLIRLDKKILKAYRTLAG